MAEQGNPPIPALRVMAYTMKQAKQNEKCLIKRKSKKRVLKIYKGIVYVWWRREKGVDCYGNNLQLI